MKSLETCTTHFRFGKRLYPIEHYTDAVSRQVVGEVMDGTSYPLYSLHQGSIAQILDLGAHVGAATIFFHCYYPQARITAVEPHPQYAKLLRKNLKECRVSAKIIEAAYVAHSDHKAGTTAHLLDGLHGPCSSRIATRKKREAIPVKTVGSNDIRFESYDLIKMDVEGHERDIFATTPISTWKNVAIIYVEYHHAETRHVIDRALRRTHTLAHARIYHYTSGELVYVGNLHLK